MSQKHILIPNAPVISGLIFRLFQGESDYTPLAAVLTGSSAADQEDRTVSGDDLATAFDNYLTNCDPYADMILAEVSGELVGYARGWWQEESPLLYIYKHNGFLLPAWRQKRIGTAMLRWIENRLFEISDKHTSNAEKVFQVSISQFQKGTGILLEGAGYTPTRYFYHMVRPHLDNIPEFPLPEGLEISPVKENHYRAIWQLVDETSKGEWGYIPPTEDAYKDWLNHPNFQPHMWTIAWSKKSDKPVGQIMAYINQDENLQYNRLRGYTEGIGVSKGWRRRGVAHALISMSLQTQKDAGMTESALVVDSENASGATSLYESCGFQIKSRDTIYQKRLGFR